MHSLLKRQLKKYFDLQKPFPKDFKNFIESVQEAYQQFDVDRAMLERSLELSSKELMEANSDMRVVFERIINSSYDGVFAFDPKGYFTVWNPGMERITGMTWEEIQTKKVFDLFPFLSEKERMNESPLNGLSIHIKEKEYRFPEKNRKGFFEGHLSPLRKESGEIIGGLTIIRDITEKKQTEQALAERAIRDYLTGFYNRHYFNYRIPKEMERARQNGQTFAILLCDIENFRMLNDSRGQQFGDVILKKVAKGIQDSIRGIDMAFRWGGDEMVVVLLDPSREGILTAANRIRTAAKKLGKEVNTEIDLSIGIVLFPEHGHSFQDLIRMADRSLYIAKKGKSKIQIGEEEYHLNENAIKVVFQGVWDIRLDIPIGYEALTRDPLNRLNVFELFKKYQSIGKLNELKQICFVSQLKNAERANLKKIFINVDFELLNQMDLIVKPPDLDVILEISEREALYDYQNHLLVAEKWKANGFKFAIDDFGSGFISLPFIAQLVPDYIKLDRSTLLQAVHSKKFWRFLKDMIPPLKNYSVEGIIAEGIETVKELEVAKEMGIFLGQGFYWEKPHEII